jgi:radical SAM superfamily enzyme YgiQ (UPF0313 family)
VNYTAHKAGHLKKLDVEMILIYPPVVKPCEPPAGIARLAGALNRHGIPCVLLDMNIEGQLYLMRQPQTAADNWTQRAIRNLSGNIAAMKDLRTYQSPDRYARAVRDVQRVLAVSGGDSGAITGLADYHHERLSPVRSGDLIKAAEHPELNPLYPFFQKRLPEIIEKGRAQAVGISLNYLSQALCAFSLIGCIRKEFPGTKIIIGGGLVSSWVNRPGWKNPFGGLVDDLIDGPGEDPLLELLNAVSVKDPSPPFGKDVGGGFSYNRQSLPDYGSLHLSDYLAPGFILPYSGADGCYWHKCLFCPETAEENAYHPVPPGQALADLKYLVAETQPALLHLLDNAINPALLRALADSPPGVPWYGFARVGRELTDGDFCIALKCSGCVMLQLGLESGDQGVLDALQKGVEIETASQVLKNLQKAGIATYVYLLFGAPPETVTEARRTLDFVIGHQEEISFLNLAIFNMPIGGPEAGKYETAPFYEGDLSLYTDFRHPRGWNRKLVRQFLEKEFKRNSAVALILKNDPPVFTSNHAAFFKRAKN